MTLDKNLAEKAQRARRKRKELKRIVKAASHAEKAQECLTKSKRRAALLNVEFTYEGQILFDIDLEDYPELVDETLALCERIRDAASGRIEGADI